MLELVCGFEPREALGHALFEFSAIRRTTEPLRFIPLMERALRFNGLYKRPHEMRDGRLWCPISEAYMSTSFANTRFCLPWLASSRWALFADGVDMLFQADPAALFEQGDERFALHVVKRDHTPVEQTKMDGQIQQKYERKNWSSVVLWNLDHPAHAKLTLDMVNELPGRDLHRFCWLEDDEIGDLAPEWNHLVGVDNNRRRPKLIHWTSGLPCMEGHENNPYADVWRKELAILDATRGKLAA